MNYLNIASLVVFLLCFPGYHLVYFKITALWPEKTKKGRINRCVHSWIEETQTNQEYLLVVHQLRNMIMGITFLATTSIIMLGFLVNFSELKEFIVKFPRPFAGGDYGTWLVLFALGYSFLNLLLALRHVNNLSVLFRSSPQSLKEVEDKSAVKYLEKLFIAGSQRYMMGRRGFLYGVVALSWYLGNGIFIVLTLLLTFILSYQHDF